MGSIQRHLVIGLLCLSWSTAAADPIEMSLLQEAPIAMNPGAINMLTFQVRHFGKTTQTLTERIELPPEWQLLLPAETLTVQPHSHFQRSLLVRLPEYVAAKTYTLTYGLSQDHTQFQLDIPVVVQRMDRLAIDALSRLDEWIMAGEERLWQVRVFNEGNAPIDLQVIPSGSVHGDVRIQPQFFTLSVQDYQDLDIRFTPTQEASGHATVGLQIESVNDSTELARWRHRVEVVPTDAGPDPMLRYPLQLSSTWQHQSDWQQRLRLAGTGYIDTRQRQHVSFSTEFHTHQQDQGAFVLERFGLSYRQQNGLLRLGDQWFGLSPLTIPVRFGRGVGLDWQSRTDSGWQAGMFRVATHHSSRNRDLTAGYIGLPIQPHSTLRIQGLSQNENESVTPDSVRTDGIAMQVRHQPHTRDTWEFEVALSDQPQAAGLGYAGRIERITRFDATAGPDRLLLKWLFAQPSYGLARSNSMTGRLVLDWTLRDDIMSRWSYHYLDPNVAKDPMRGSVLTEHLWTTEWHWAITDSWRWSLAYRLHVLAEPLAGKPLATQLYQVGLGYRQRQWGWQGQLQQASPLSSNTLPHRFSGSFLASVQSTPQWRIRTQWRWSQAQHLRSIHLLDERRDWSVQAHWRPHPQWQLQFGYRRGLSERYLTKPQQTQSGFMRTQLQWHDQQTLSAQINHQSVSPNSSTTTLALHYELQFNPALKRRQTLGGLYGQVSGVDGAPIAGALVRANDQVVRTDPAGYYEFRALPPASYDLQIQLPGESHQALIDHTDRSVEVVGGQRTRWPVVLQSRGHLLGQFHWVSSKGMPSWVDSPQLSGIELMVIKADQHHWVHTNTTGSFHLMGLTPGYWEVRVLSRSLPERTEIDPLVQTVLIEPGQYREIEWVLESPDVDLDWLNLEPTLLQLD